MFTLLNSTLSLDQQLHCLTGDIIQIPDATDLSTCEQLANLCNRSVLFRFTSHEQRAIYQKLQEIKSIARTQPKCTETHPVLLTHLLLIISRSDVDKTSNSLLEYANQIAATQKFLDFANISVMLRHLSKFTQLVDTQPILNTLLSCLTINRENNQTMNVEELSTAFFGLENAKFPDLTIEKIIKELTWHAKQSAKNKQWLSGSQLARSFFGLASLLQWDKTADEALQALFSHMQQLTQTNNWLDGRQLDAVSRLLKNIPLDNKILTAMLTELREHIQGNTNDKNWFESTWIESILHNLQHLRENNIAISLFATLFPHIQYTDKEYPLSLKGIEYTLSILRTSTDNSFIIERLSTLSAHLESQYVEQSEGELRSWLNNAHFQLKDYLETSAPAVAQSAAQAFLQKAIDVFEPVVTLSLDTPLPHINNTGRTLPLFRKEELLDALPPHIKHLTQNKEWLQKSEIASVIESLAHVHFDDKSQAILSEIIPHIENQSKQKKWIGAEYIRLILDNISTLQAKEVSIPTLLAMTPDIQHIASKYPLTLADIHGVLSILPGLSNQVIALEILAALTKELSLQVIEETKDKEIKFTNYALQARSYLHQYLDPTKKETHEVALIFLQKIVEIFKLPFTVKFEASPTKSSDQEKVSSAPSLPISDSAKIFHPKKLAEDTDSDDHATHSTHSSHYDGETSSNSSSSSKE